MNTRLSRHHQRAAHALSSVANLAAEAAHLDELPDEMQSSLHRHYEQAHRSVRAALEILNAELEVRDAIEAGDDVAIADEIEADA